MTSSLNETVPILAIAFSIKYEDYFLRFFDDETWELVNVERQHGKRHEYLIQQGKWPMLALKQAILLSRIVPERRQP